MRRRTLWGVLLLAALSVGVLLPRAAAGWDDARHARTEWSGTVSGEAIVKNMAWEFSQRLSNFDLSVSLMETDHEGNLDDAAAEAAARELLDQMTDWGVLPPDSRWELERLEYYLVIGRENAVVTGKEQLGGYYAWLCSFSDASGDRIGLVVDDETGLLLAAGATYGEADTSLDTMRKALRFAAFCEESCSFTLRTVRRLPYTEGGRICYELQFSDRDGEVIAVVWKVGQNSFKYQAMIPFL